MDKNLSKLVSILMPAFNVENYIEEAIQSVIAQTYPFWELIILDDFSTDATYEKALKFQSGKIRVYRNKKNLGVVQTRNILFTYARGKYIAIQDADDLSHPSRLEEQVKILQENPHYCLIGTGVEYFGEKKETYAQKIEHEELKTLLFFYNPIAHSTVMFNRELLTDQELYYNTYHFLAEDYELINRLLVTKTGYLTDKVLVKYRIHAGNTSHKSQQMILGQQFALFSHLYRIGMFVSLERIVLLHKILFIKTCKEDEIISSIKLLNELELINEQIGYYQAELFNRRIKELQAVFLFTNLLSREKYTFRLISIFHAALKARPLQISMLQRLKFYIKCLIFYSTKK